MSVKSKVGVLVMSYGTPESLEGIEAYYTHIVEEILLLLNNSKI